jgi:V8-like Glu-specific endopeptidase
MPITEVSASQRLQDPYAKCGVVFVEWPDGTSTSGSCAVVGRNDILTAAHVVYNPDRGGWASGLSFYFGADFNASAGRFDSYAYSYSLNADYRWTARAYVAQAFADGDNARMTDAETQYDVAIVGVSRPVGDVTGWFGLDWGRNQTQWVTQVGYPGSGTGMMSGPVNVSRSNLWEVYTATTDRMGPGSSGGPLFTPDGYVIGVKSGGLGNSSTWADFGFLSNFILETMRENDALLAPTPTYALQASALSVNEGASAAFTLSTTNVAAGTAVPYTVSGVSPADVVGGALQGTAIIGANGRASISVAIAADGIREGAETMTISAGGASASIVINDTSVPVVTVPTSFALVRSAPWIYDIRPLQGGVRPTSSPDLFLAKFGGAWSPEMQINTERLLAWYHAQGVLREFSASVLLAVVDFGLTTADRGAMIDVLGLIADADMRTGTPVLDGIFSVPVTRIGVPMADLV